MGLSRNLAARLALVLASVLLTLVAAEIALRYWFHAIPQLELDLYERDGAGNLRLRPGIERRHVTRLWDVHIRINREGWRDRDAPPGAAAPVVLGLGDSMAFGWGVELEDSFLYLLESRLAAEIPVRLVKAGVPGTGPGDQLHLLETVWPQYKPRGVILCFFVGNDFVDVQMGGSRQFRVEDGLLTRVDDRAESSFDKVRSWLVRSSHLLQLLRAVQLNLMRPAASAGAAQGGVPRRWDEWLREFAQVHRKEYPERTQRAVDETMGYLDRFEALCRSRAAPFVLVVIPRSFQIYPREREELLRELQLSESDLDLDRPQRVLSEWASRRGVTMVDLLPAFRSDYQENPAANLYYYPDAHMNARGHRLAAETIYRDAAAMDAIRSGLAGTAAVDQVSPGHPQAAPRPAEQR